MPDTPAPPREIAAGPDPAATARRSSLLGVTIMLIEDSPETAEAIRLLATASGARLRRADSLTAASRHLAIYRPGVAIVDLGLPDGCGLTLIRQLADLSAARPGIIALSGGDKADWGATAREAGADTLLEKPLPGIEAFSALVRSVLPAVPGDSPADGAVIPFRAIA